MYCNHHTITLLPESTLGYITGKYILFPLLRHTDVTTVRQKPHHPVARAMSQRYSSQSIFNSRTVSLQAPVRNKAHNWLSNLLTNCINVRNSREKLWDPDSRHNTLHTLMAQDARRSKTRVYSREHAWISTLLSIRQQRYSKSGLENKTIHERARVERTSPTSDNRTPSFSTHRSASGRTCGGSCKNLLLLHSSTSSVSVTMIATRKRRRSGLYDTPDTATRSDD